MYSQGMIKEARILAQRVNRVRAKQRQALQGRLSPEEYEKKYKRDFSLHDRDPDVSKRKNVNWKTFLDTLRNQANPEYFTKRDEQFLRNWMHAAFNELGDVYGSVLYSMLKDISPARFAQLVENNPRALEMDYVYGASQQHERFRTVLETLKREGITYPEKIPFITEKRLFAEKYGLNKLAYLY